MTGQWDATGKLVISNGLNTAIPPNGAEPLLVCPQQVQRHIERALWAQGIKSKLNAGKRRHEFQADHGFRKWFKTRCESVGMRSINIETLMGHSLGPSDSYYRPTEDEILNDYLKTSRILTLNEEHILYEEVQNLRQDSKDTEHVIGSKLYEKDKIIESMKNKYDSELLIMRDAISELQNLLRYPEKLNNITN